MARDDDELEQDDERLGYILVTLGPAAFKNQPPGGAQSFHEYDDRHPYHSDKGGEAHVVAGPMEPGTNKVITPRVVKVYPTPGVRGAIASGLLKEVTGRAKETPRERTVAEVIDGANVPVAQATATAVAVGDEAGGSTSGEGATTSTKAKK